MCGICGIVYEDASRPVNREVLVAMRDTLTRRGPDDAGIYLAPGVGLGSRRLAILDLSERAHMPMATRDGRYSITYNGEVYNYREFRSELEARGYTFRSNSDTEVVLYLYAEYGAEMLNRLNGMFSMAIWDQQERSLLIARDRLGVKPLYYAQQHGALYFGSEEKALFAAGVDKSFDPTTWEELLCFRYVAGERTPYSAVKRLLPGHYLTWKAGKIEIRRWWDLRERSRAITPPENPVEWFKTTFDDAVNLRRISDVPVGVLLSGGLDSSSVAASIAKQAGDGVASFTVRFNEPRYDEGPLARQVAERWKLEHHELIVSPGNLLERVYRASFINDEPLVHGNDLHLWAISEYAKPRVTVLLSGEGGDETLGGYVRYRPLAHSNLIKLARPFHSRAVRLLGLKGRLEKLGRFLDLGSIDRFVFFNSCDVLPDDLRSIGMDPVLELSYRHKVLNEAKELYPGDPLRQAMYSDHHTFLCSILDRNDRMTMGASIECRVPFLDYRLVEGLASLRTRSLIDARRSKILLRQALGDRLPEGIMKHPKWGFAVPWSNYLREVPELRSLVEQLPKTDPIIGGPFDRRKLTDVIKMFLAGDTRHDALVRQLAMVAIWYQACFAVAPIAQPARQRDGLSLLRLASVAV